MGYTPLTEEIHMAQELSAWAQQYLKWLGLEPEPPSWAALVRLTERHLQCVPFENVTTLLRFRTYGSNPPVPDPYLLLENWQRRRGGGLCYEVSRTLARLLQELGYLCFSIFGTITFPGSHEALVVEVEGRRYLVDVGNGAPFFHPIPIGEEVEVCHAGLRYRFRPGADGRTLIQDRWIAEGWTPFCVYDLEPKSEEELHPGYVRHHTPGEGKFLGELMLVRCDKGGVYRLRNQELVHFRDGEADRQMLTTREAYLRVAHEVFQMPELPILDALRVLERLGIILVEEGAR